MVTVEFAIVLPVFLLLVFASIEFSRMNILRHAVENASYEAARVGICPGASATQVETAAANYMQNVIHAHGTVVTVTPNPIVDDTDAVTVRVQLPLDQNSWVAPTFSAGKSIVSDCTLRTERYRGIPIPPP